MKLLLRRNVPNLGKIGEVVEVKPGYARNYLLPERLAVEPTAGNLKRVEAEKQAYLEELARVRAGFEAKAALLNGRAVAISALCNEQGHLYGSIGPAQIVAALAADNLFIEARNVLMSEPIRQIDEYEVKLRFTEEVTAAIRVVVTPSSDSPPLVSKEEQAAAPTADETPAESEGEGEDKG